jgi:hypothetical protein
MKGPRPYYSPSKSHRKAISIVQKNKNVSIETKKKISLCLSKPIYVYDSKNYSLLHFFPTIIKAKNTLKISTKTIGEKSKELKKKAGERRKFKKKAQLSSFPSFLLELF